jgi:hypothetical protein
MVFPDSPMEGMVGVHLYFAKLLGCGIKEQGCPATIRKPG